MSQPSSLKRPGILSAERLGWLGAIVALLAVCAYLFRDLLFFGRVLFFGDLCLYFIPQLDFEQQAALAGRIPLWNPYLYTGTPFVGNPQAWPLYPSSLLLFFSRAETMVGVIGATHCLLAGLGILAFLRRRGLSAGAALIGAIAFGCGGALVSKMQFPNMVQAAAYFGWLLWSLDRAIDRPTARRAAEFGVIGGLALLAAHPQVAMMQFYLGFAWLLFRLRDRWLLFRLRDRPRSAWSVPLVTVAGGGAVAGLIASAQLLPVVQMALVSVRPSLSLDAANRFHLWLPGGLLNFILPSYFGNPGTGREYTGHGNFWEPCCYAGVLPLSLALLALLRPGGARRRDILFWTGAALCCLWLSFGKAAGLYTLAYYALPGVSRFHDPARFLLPATFAIAMLSSLGANRLWSVLRERVPLARMPLAAPIAAALATLLIAIDLLPFSQTLNPTTPKASFDVARDDLRRLMAGSARVLQIDNDRVIQRYGSYRTYDFVGNDLRVRHLLASGAPNMGMLVNAGYAIAYEPVSLSTILTIKERVGSWPGVRSLGVDRSIRMDQFAWTSTGTPVSDARPHTALVSAGKTTPLVRQMSDPESFEIALPQKHSGGALVLADAPAPGWIAQIDGRPVTVGVADDVFRRIPIEPADRSVRVRYNPTVWRVGLFFTLLGLLIAGILWLAPTRGAQEGALVGES